MKQSTIFGIAAVAIGAAILSKKKSVSGIGQLDDLTEREFQDAYRIYSYVLSDKYLFDESYAVFMQDRSGHGFPAQKNIHKWLKYNIPGDYSGKSDSVYDFAAYLLTGDYFGIFKGDKTIERAQQEAKAELNAALNKTDYYKLFPITIPDSVIAKWKDMTDNNQHSEVLLDISEYLDMYSDKFDNFVRMFRSFIVRETRAGYLTTDLWKERNVHTESLLNRIRSTFGDSVAKQVYDCL